MAVILFVAYHFAPENTSGTHRSLHFARALMDAGHDVWVIAGPHPAPARCDPELERVFPWPNRVQRVATPTSLGSVYAAMKRSLPASHGVNSLSGTQPVHTPKAAQGLVSRLRHHIRVWEALPDHQRSWRSAAVSFGSAQARRIGAHIIFASGPPWTGMMAGYRIALGRRLPFIADYRDPWTSRSGANWRYAAQWAQHKAENWDAEILGQAAIVSFNSPRLARIADERNTLGTRCRVILNGSDVPRRTQSAAFAMTAPLRLRHFGSLYAGRSVATLVQGIDELITSGRLRPDEIELELVGDAEMSSNQRAELMRARVPIRLTPQVTFAEAARQMAEPNVLVLVQTEQHAGQIPTKLYDYLCTGNPTLVLSPSASASWDLASSFARCHRLDLEPTDWNRQVLGQMFDDWRQGKLHQEASVDDTADLGKPTIGTQFVRLVEELAYRPAQLRRRNASCTT